MIQNITSLADENEGKEKKVLHHFYLKRQYLTNITIYDQIEKKKVYFQIHLTFNSITVNILTSKLGYRWYTDQNPALNLLGPDFLKYPNFRIRNPYML